MEYDLFLISSGKTFLLERFLHVFCCCYQSINIILILYFDDIAAVFALTADVCYIAHRKLLRVMVVEVVVDVDAVVA